MEKKSRKELQEDYKQIKTYMGVIQLTNKINGKIFIATYPNLKNRWITLQDQLSFGMHPNFQLQSDWKELGPETFTYEVLEEKDAGEVSDVRWELKQMELPWLEKLQPYGDRGYNRQPKEEL